MFSQAYYKTEQYYLAGYQFESLLQVPKSEKYRKLLFIGPKSYSMLSPIYSLDQTDTYKAIDKITGFYRHLSQF
jgi:outer membrane protein assembly factor BamD